MQTTAAGLASAGTAPSATSALDPGVRVTLMQRQRSSARSERTLSDGAAVSVLQQAYASSAPRSETEEVTVVSAAASATAAASSPAEDAQFAAWRAQREAQAKAAEEMVSAMDLVKAAALLAAFRAASHALGFKARRVAGFLALAALVRAMWKARAPRRVMQTKEGEYSVLPFGLGQLGLVYDALTKSGFITQLAYAKSVNYRSVEITVWGGLHEMGIMDPNDREYMLRTNFTNFTKNAPNTMGFLQLFDVMMGRGIFAVDGEEWKAHRRIAATIFSNNGLRLKMDKCFAEHADHLIAGLKPKAASGVEFDVQDVFAAFTFDTISSIAFGSNPGALDAAVKRGEKIDFLVRFDRLQQNLTLRFVLPQPIWRAMRYLNVGTERQVRVDARELQRVCKGIVEEKRRVLAAAGGGASLDSDDPAEADLLALYIKTGIAQNKPHLLEDQYLIDMVLNMMIAGRDTTSSTLTNMFRLLSDHPAVADQMRAEFKRVVGDRHVTFDDVRELRYCSGVFNEVLRLYPPVPGDFRICNQDCTLPSGLFIPAGCYASISNGGIGRDPKLWSEPESFKPERWLDPANPSAPTRRVDEFIHPVFWGGPRLCLGKDMARLEALTVAKALLENFDVRVVPGQTFKAVDGPVIFWEKGVRVTLKPRA